MISRLPYSSPGPMLSLDWQAIGTAVDENGNALLEALLTPEQCAEIIGWYPNDRLFRTRINMVKHGFGLGEYKYFQYPLPAFITELRAELYTKIVPIANRWSLKLGTKVNYPATLSEFIDRCHFAGQLRPTPLVLKYGAGDYNCLHQDLYGEHMFPLQVAIILSKPGTDYVGGQFIMTEKASTGTRAEVIIPQQGDGILFAVNQRPIFRSGRLFKAAMKHGVSKIIEGNRFTLGMIFHDSI